MIQFLRKPSSLSIICPLWTILIICIMVCVHGQYPGPYNGPSPYGRQPMAFSPYHPARINHETLPISQAEFAQLVAESMATSRGPHHHHPPNTDADYEGPDHWNRESTPSASSAAKSMHPNHVHPANRQYQTSESSAIRQQDPSSAAMYHHQQQLQLQQQQRAMAQSSMSMGHPHPHHQRQYSPYSSMRPQPTAASASASPYTNQYHPSDVDASSNGDDDYRQREPSAAAHHPSQSMQYQPEESRFAASPGADDDDNDDQYMRAPVFGSQPETSEDEPDQHTYGGRPSSPHDYLSGGGAQANYHGQQRHPGGPPESGHDYPNDRVHPMTAAMLQQQHQQQHQHQHQPSQSVQESMSGPAGPIGPQPMYHPNNDPSSLAYHQDFSHQLNRANYHPSAASSSSSPVHPFSQHGYPTGYGHSQPRQLHGSAAAHLPRHMQMYGDGSQHQANYYNAAHHHAASYGRHHQHPHAYPRPRPEDMYMAASSETDSLIASPDADPATGSGTGTTTTDDDKSTKPAKPATTPADKSDK